MARREIFKEIDLSKLPTYKNKINWSDSIGCEINFVYDNIKGSLVIKKYIKENHKLKVEYNNKIYEIYTSNILDCCLGRLLEKFTINFKIEVGNIFKDNNRNLTITDRKYVLKNKRHCKYYKYTCNICGSTDLWMIESELLRGVRCSCCANRTIVEGINDMWTTNPELAKLLADYRDGYIYTQSSGKKVDWICPVCGTLIKNKDIWSINYYSLSCPKCSDGISYPNKFMFSILDQLKINFIPEYSPSWIKPRRYDFYFELNNRKYIIEMDGGLGHGKKGFHNSESSKEIDEYKDNMALKHNIKIIRIDCDVPNQDLIKDRVLQSEIRDILDLDIVDWMSCCKSANTSKVLEVCNLWNSGIKSSQKIAGIMNLSHGATVNYLNKGNTVKLCEYIPNQCNKKKVICLNTMEIYETVIDTERKTGSANQSISKCCKGELKSAGKLNGESLKWMYYEDFTKSNDEIICKKMNNIEAIRVPVICKNNNMIFKTVADAKRWCGLKSCTGIFLCLEGKQKHSGKHPITNEPLMWTRYKIS